MFVDLSEIVDGSKLDFDLCIIGAGAAGITLAREHAGSAAKICLLEAGGFDYESEVQALYEGEVSGIEYLPLDVVRLRYFGGTTNHWAGQSLPLDPLDFRHREWVEASGWPISYTEFASYLPRAQSVCKLGTPDFAWNTWKDKAGFPEFPLAGGDFEPVVLRFPEPVTRFGEAYRDDVEKASNVTCILHANVLRVDTNTSGTHATAVELAGIGNRRVIVSARFFIVATGGIENARLLLLSGPQGGPGLGNENDQVGRYFMEHPNFDTSEVVLSDVTALRYLAQPYINLDDQPFRLDFQLSAQRQAELEILNHSAFLVSATPAPGKEFMSKAMAYASRSWNSLGRTLGLLSETKTFKMRVRLEIPPRYESRVKLSRERDFLGLQQADVSMILGEQETRTVAAVHEAFAHKIGSQQLGRMRVDQNAIKQLSPEDLGWQIHHCGGTRMSSSPRTGVVDENCKIHGVDNVYVAGSSVFPTGGHANPTMNLLALTLRLSDHMKEKLAL